MCLDEPHRTIFALQTWWHNHYLSGTIRSARAAGAGSMESLVDNIISALRFRLCSSEENASDVAKWRGAIPYSPKSWKQMSSCNTYKRHFETHWNVAKQVTMCYNEAMQQWSKTTLLHRFPLAFMSIHCCDGQGWTFSVRVHVCPSVEHEPTHPL